MEMSPAASERQAGAGRAGAGRLGTGPDVLRRHWLLAVLLAAGLTLRILAEVAYRPALFFSDSVRYLYLSGGNDPLGYRVLLKPVLLVGNLDAVAAVQHLIGLGMAIALYVVLLRRGAPRWLAALATAPVLVDGYQLQMEQSIMSDVLFEVLIVAGLVILLCERKPRTWMFIAGGLVLGASATVREVGQILILPALIFVLAAVPGWRRKLRQAAVLAAAFLLPILAYCTTSLAATGHFRLANQGTNELYGRVVLAANCHALRLPADEQALCPTGSLALKLGNDALVHSPQSPLRSFRPPGAGTSAIAGDFTHRVFWQDPLAVFAAIGGDALKLFAVTRVTDAGDTPIARWQFQPTYPTYQHVSLQTVRAAGQRYGGGGPAVDEPLAAFLRAYQLDGGYTPGPLLLLCTLAGLAGSIGVLRKRRGADADADTDAEPAASVDRDSGRDVAVACLLFFATAVILLLVSDAFEFSWRYQLPALVTLPPAGALGLLAVAGYLTDRRRRSRPAVTAAALVQAAHPSALAGANDSGTRPASSGTA